MAKLESLSKQAKDLQDEIDAYVVDAVSGKIPVDKLTFESNKVFKKEGNETREINGNLAQIFYSLAEINCDLWHEQEKVYEFEKVPSDEKDIVVKKLAILNLERNKCIDAINKSFASMIKS